MNEFIPPGHPEDIKNVHFPRAGADTSLAFWRQPNRALRNKDDYARSSIKAVNVRGYDPLSMRYRGGSRAGLERYIDAQAAGQEWIIQGLSVVISTAASAES